MNQMIYPEAVLPSKLKRNRLEEPIHKDLDEIEVLTRFDSMLRALICRGRFKLLSKPLTFEDKVKEGKEDTLLELCVIYAFDGSDYIGEVRENIQYVVLQAALILTITVNLYVNPPVFTDDDLLRAFSALSGFAAFSHLVVIIGSTISAAVLNMGYGPIDTFFIYKSNRSYIAFVFILNYIADLATIAAVLIAGFNRASIDGYVQLYIIPLILFLLAYLIKGTGSAKTFQDKRIYDFYIKYCDPNGDLKDEYLELINNGKSN